MIIKPESRTAFYGMYTEYKSSEAREPSFMNGRSANEDSEMPSHILVFKDKFPSNIRTVEFLGRDQQWSSLTQSHASKTEVFNVEEFDDLHKQLVKVKRVFEVVEGGIETEIVKKKKGE